MGKYTDKVPTYDIDLGLPESERWAEVIRKEKRVARRFARDATSDFPPWLTALGGPIFKLILEHTGGRYVEEIEAWADPLGVSNGEAALLNCSYELSHAWEFSTSLWNRITNPFGCTAGIRVIGGEQVHVRNMDWPIASLGDATRVFRFQGGDHDFTIVSMVGFVGALSGVVPGAYSVTINWAPPAERPTFDFGPAFLLREVFETCATYEDAVDALKHTTLSTSVFFTVCGATPGQACVIERTRDESAVRKIAKGALVQANHHVAKKFRDNNECIHDEDADDESLYEDSMQRADALQTGLDALRVSASLDEAAACLDIEPVRNDNTYQQMLFVPRTGEVRVWRWMQ